MIFDRVTPQEMQAAHVVTAATMVGLLGARVFGRYANRVRLAVAAAYFTAVVGFILYYML
ncbi:MAG: hypothetical protein U1E70_21820 [Acetobacteraceae bacterium]